ncbi:TonB-dependent receptor, partial [Rhodovulum sulfidophilum]
ETAINYELGLKGTLGGDMWRYALSAFYMDIKDQQVYSMKGSSTVFSIANAPKSRSKGLELSFDGQATRNLRLGAAFGYADATFVDYPGSKIGDASGNRQPLSSKYTAALTAEYRLPLAGDSDLVVNADYTWRSKFYFDAENTLPQSAYGLANASVAIETGTWDLQLYCDNLFDKHYLRSAANLTEGDFGYAGAERTFGIRFTRTF